MTIVKFLTARLDEDEAIARAATGDVSAGRWQYGPLAESVTTTDGGYVACGPWGCGMDDDEAAHIARHDPTRALADVAAKRDVIEQLQDAEHRINSEWGVGSLKESDWVFIFALMAAVYSDHPDYQQEWKR